MAINTDTNGYSLRVREVLVRPIHDEEEAEWDQVVSEDHPLGNPHFPGHQIKYVAEHRGRAVALLCFSASAYHLGDRDRRIGWSQEQRMQRRHLVVQNSRFLVLASKAKKNLASRVLSQCALRIGPDWTARFGFEPLMLETFVDPVHFHGTCYKSAGWEHVGSTCGFRRDGREFYSPDSSPKQIWLKPLVQDAAALLRSEVLPEELRAWEKPLKPKRVVERLGWKSLRSLFEALQEVPDPRSRKGAMYPLASCLAILFCAQLAGCEGMRECAEFAASLRQCHLEALRFRRNRRTGRYEAPKYVTLWRVAAMVDAAAFERVVTQWVNAEGICLEAIALDGKALRATRENEDGGSFVVSAISHSGTPFFSISSSPQARARRSQPHGRSSLERET